MKLIDIFSQLTTGELSNVNIGGLENGEIKDENYKAVMNHINLGLTALYTRFNLKEGHLILNLQQSQATYSLDSKYAVSNTKSKEPVKYILDSASSPFKDDILKIESITTPYNIDVSLNTGWHPYKCTTPSGKVLRVPLCLIDGSTDAPEYLRNLTFLNVYYRANHVLYDPDSGGFQADKIDIELPQSHLQALLYYVASRVNNPIGLGQEFNAGNTYAAKFERECQVLEGQSMELDPNQYHTKLYDRGFV